MSSQPPSLFRAFATVGSYTMLSRVTGLLREVLYARFLGTGADMAAFLIAQQFPNLFRSLFAEGAFSAGFVPIFSQMLERDGKEKAKQFADESFSVLFVILLFFCAAVEIAMPLVLYLQAPGFTHIPGQMARTRELAQIAFPYLLFVSLTSLQSGVLNSFGRFAVPSAAPLLANVTIIAALLLGISVGGDRAMFLSWGILATGVVQFVWLWLDCRRIGVGFHFARPRLTPDVKRLMKRILPVAFGSGIYHINVLASSAIATLISASAVAWIGFANRLTLLPVGIFGYAIGVALLPLLTRQIHSGNEEAASASQNRAIEMSLMLTIPAAVGLGMLAEPIVSTLFEGNKFTAMDRVAVAHALLAFSIGLPAYVLNKALTPGFFARHDTRTTVIVSAVAVVVNIGLNLALMRPFGHVGIAVGSSVSAWINAGLLALILHRRRHLVMDDRLIRRLPRMALASAVMGFALWFGTQAVMHVSGPVFGAPGLPAGPNGLRIIVLSALIGGGIVVFAVSALLCGAATRQDLGMLRRARRPVA